MPAHLGDEEPAGRSEETGGTEAWLAIVWCLVDPDISTVITGASRAGQVTVNMKAMEVLQKLTPEVIERSEAIVANRPEPE